MFPDLPIIFGPRGPDMSFGSWIRLVMATDFCTSRRWQWKRLQRIQRWSLNLQRERACVVQTMIFPPAFISGLMGSTPKLISYDFDFFFFLVVVLILFCSNLFLFYTNGMISIFYRQKKKKREDKERPIFSWFVRT